MNKHKYKAVTAKSPCPACTKPDWCAWRSDGVLRCERSDVPPHGMRLIKALNGGALFAPIEWRELPARNKRSVGKVATATPIVNHSVDYAALTTQFTKAITTEQVASLAARLHVRPETLVGIGIGWATRVQIRQLKANGKNWLNDYPDGAFSFPERDATGAVIGIGFRTIDGRKGGPKGARRGLVIPDGVDINAAVVLTVEGPTDVAAMTTLGITAIGRPSNQLGAEALSLLLRSHNALIVGENDQKSNGKWPGRDGAVGVSEKLSSAWCTPTRWALPPVGIKDVRDWLVGRVDGGLDLNNRAACESAGAELLAFLAGGATTVTPSSTPTPQSEGRLTDCVVNMVLENYRVGVSIEGKEPFIVPNAGPNIAYMLKADGEMIRERLSRDYRRTTGRTLSATVLSDALTAVCGEALDVAPESLHLRRARHEDGIVIDLGTPDGKAVLVKPSGWEVIDRSPVLFRRSSLTGELPVPVHGGDINGLRELLHLGAEEWSLLLGWLMSASMPGASQPILLLGGEQGTGKTTCARFILGLLDPGAGMIRSAPQTPEQWAITAAAGTAFAVDNIRQVPNWWSDQLCMAVTGDTWMNRRLYSNSGVATTVIRAAVILTSIDTGALRGDLADRLVRVDLEPISEDQRALEVDLVAKYEQGRAGWFGAVLDLICKVLQVLPTVKCQRLPRMADFAIRLAAMDTVLGTSAFDAFMRQGPRIAGEVIADDTVGVAIVEFMRGRSEWSGPAGVLLGLLPMQAGTKPRHPTGLARRLLCIAPALRAIGITVTRPRHGDKKRVYKITTNDTFTDPSDGEHDGPDGAGPARAFETSVQVERPDERPPETAPEPASTGHVGHSGVQGVQSGHPSEQSDLNGAFMNGGGQ